jgi:DNA-binding LytR/AlgR family response regulator
MINCIVIDDNAADIMQAEHFISNTEGLSLVQSFSNAVEASKFITKDPSATDLIFLDIEMPGMSGMEFLSSHKNLPPVILITSKERYAVKAFEHNAVHYLLKPLAYSEFLKAVKRVFKHYEIQSTQDQDYIFIKEGGLVVKLLQKDIWYCESLWDYVKIYTKDKTCVVYSTMKNIEDKLKSNKQFIRLHRSYIINTKFLENFNAENAVVAGRAIPIDNKYKTRRVPRPASGYYNRPPRQVGDNGPHSAEASEGRAAFTLFSSS